MIPQQHITKNNRGAASAQFPGKLHDMITFAEAEGLSYIISFVQSGTAIMVHDPDRLMQILPHFGFCQTQYRSFQRQLNMWHFERILDGRYKSAWIHPYFIRGNKALCSLMNRHGVPPAKSEIMEKLLSNSNNVTMLQTNIPPRQSDPETCVVTSAQSICYPGQTDLENPKLKLGMMHAQKLDCQCSGQDDSIVATSTEFVCSTEDIWAPLPAEKSILNESTHPSREHLDFFARLQSTLHFPMEAQALLEPTPLRERSCAKTRYTDPDSVMSQLLEPIYALDDIF